jgi:hypothetical protein
VGEDYLDRVRKFIEIHIHPAGIGPCWDEWTPYASIHHNKPLVFPVHIVLRQHLCESPKVIALVFSLDYFDVVALGNALLILGVAVQDEDEVGRCVQAVCDEEVEIDARLFRFEICIQYQRSVLRS